MSSAIQLYALEKNSFNQAVCLASLNRGLKYLTMTLISK